jgi:hypothetical protein
MKKLKSCLLESLCLTKLWTLGASAVINNFGVF